MLIYIAIFAFLMICSFINLSVEKEKMKMIYIGICIVLVGVIVFRDHLGGSDYYVYKNYFENIPKLQEINLMNYHIEYEVGYKYLNSLIKTITDNHYILFFIIGIITFPIISYINYKYCKYVFFTMSFYMYKTFFYSNFIAMRQVLAMAFFMIGIKYIIEKDFKKYMFCILIATLFHSSAIILIGVYFVRNLNLYKRNLMQIILLGGGILLFSNKIIDIVESIMKTINMESTVIEKIEGISSSAVINLHVIEIIGLYIIFRKFYYIKTERDKIVLNIFILYMILLIGFSTQVIFIRVSMYFYIFIMMFISKGVEGIQNKKYKRILVYILLLIFLLGYIKYLVQFDNGGLMPYKSILFK